MCDDKKNRAAIREKYRVIEGENTEKVVNALDSVLRAARINHSAIARSLGLTDTAISGNFSVPSMPLGRVFTILDEFGIDRKIFFKELENDYVYKLDNDAEEAFSKDLTLLFIAILLGNGWTPDQILSEYDLSNENSAELSRKIVDKALLKLKKIDIVKLTADGKFERFSASPNFKWNRYGFIDTFVRKKVLLEYFDSTFNGSSEFKYIPMTLSKDKYDLAKDIIEQAHQKLIRLMNSDSMSDPADRINCSAALAIRQWQYSEFPARRTKPQN